MPESRRNIGLLFGLLGVGFLMLSAATMPVTAAVQQNTRKQYQVLNVKNWGAKGDGKTDDTIAIQAALLAVSPNTTLRFPAGTYPISNYLKLSQKHHVRIEMQGSIKPSVPLGNVNSGVLDITDCRDLDLSLRVVNTAYRATCNAIRLQRCQQVTIHDSQVDLNCGSYDGTAAIQLGTKCQAILITKNYLRAGYGILANDIPDVSGVVISYNNIQGQREYGSLGTGDAIEFNCPTFGANRISLLNNEIFDYEAHNPTGADARIIAIGLSNVSDFHIVGNTFRDSQMEAIHIENGCRNGTISRNIINSGIHGINITPNSNRDITDLIISDNHISTGPVPNRFTHFGPDYGAALLLNVNPVGRGFSRRIVISNNRMTGNSSGARGLCVYDADDCRITNNSIRGFPRRGIDIRRFGHIGRGPSRLYLANNQVSDCGLPNLVLPIVPMAPPAN